MRRRLPRSENIAAALLFLFAATLPALLSAYRLDTFTGFLIMALLSFSVTLIWGYTGIFSFGQAAFYGIGAYAYAIVSIAAGGGGGTIAGIFAGVLTAGATAGVIGYFMFYGRISGVFTGIITLCVSIALETFMVQASDSAKYHLLGVPLGGFNGITGIPPISLGGFRLTQLPMYVFTLLCALAAYLLMRGLERSKWGYALFSVRESQTRSELFGYNTALIQTVAFAASGCLAGFAGTLFASWSAYVVPSTLNISASTLVVVMVATAGRKNVTGAAIMTLAYSWLAQQLASTGSQYSNIILGALLLVVVVFMPDGILTTLFGLADRALEKALSKPRLK